MISPMLYRILTLFLIWNIGGSKCENEPKDESVRQRVMSDQDGEPDYLNQIERVLSTILGKIEKLDKQMKESKETYKNLSDGMAFLRLEVKNLSSAVYPEQPSNLFAQRESPFVLDVSTLRDGRGAIVFNGKEMVPRKRRFWTLERAGEMTFTMESNELKPNSRITISGFKTTVSKNAGDHLDEVYINSSTANGTEFTVSGVVVLVSLTSNNTDGRGLASSFILRFLHKRNDKVLIPGRVLYPSTFVTGERRVVAAFPENNAANYSNNANHFMIISRPNGRDFNLTRIFTDIEKEKDYLRVYYIKDDAEKTQFGYWGPYWGRWGRVNLPWGRDSTFVFFFSSDGSGTGKGYEFTIE